MKSLISIIVPVYNEEKNIETCIHSLINQTYSNIQIIIVDDGSKDKTAEKCRILSEEDSRIDFISQLNQGPSAARNAGLEYAKGEYIQFVDADDYVDDDYCEKMLNGIVHGKADYVICGYSEHKDLQKQDKSYDLCRMSIARYGEFIRKDPMSFYIGVLWNKIYRKDIIQNHHIKFNPSLKLGEDFVFNLYYLQYVKWVYQIPDILYQYICRSFNSLSREKKSPYKLIDERVELYKAYESFWTKIGKHQILKFRIHSYIYRYFIFSLLELESMDISESEKDNIKDYIYYQVLPKLKLSLRGMESYKRFRLFAASVYRMKHYGLLNEVRIVWKRYQFTVRQKRTCKKRILLYSDSSVGLQCLYDYYYIIRSSIYADVSIVSTDSNKNKDISNIEYLTITESKRKKWDLIVSSSINILDFFSNEYVPILYIKPGYDSEAVKNGNAPFIYAEYLDKNNYRGFTKIVEENSYYKDILIRENNEFIGLIEHVGSRWNRRREDEEISDEISEDLLYQKLIIVGSSIYDDGLLKKYGNRIVEQLESNCKDYMVFFVIHNQGYIDVSCEWYHALKHSGIHVIENDRDLLSMLRKASLIISDYSIIYTSAIINDKPLILTDYECDHVWKYSEVNHLYKIVPVYTNECCIDNEMIRNVIQGYDWHNIYSEMKLHLLDKNDYSTNLCLLTENLLKTKLKERI